MPKGSPDSNDELMELLKQVNQKVSSARILNGAFDKLEIQIEEIKQNQNKADEKLERLFDPEEGIYAKAQKTELLLSNMAVAIDKLTEFDKKVFEQVKNMEDTVKTTVSKVDSIEKISGADNKDLENAVKTSKGFWKFTLWAGAALLTAIGKMAWDLFIV